MKRRTYGYDRVKLYQHYTTDELSAMAVELRDGPANANTTPGDPQLYNRVTQRRLANIAYAIYYHHQDTRARGVA